MFNNWVLAHKRHHAWNCLASSLIVEPRPASRGSCPPLAELFSREYYHMMYGAQVNRTLGFTVGSVLTAVAAQYWTASGSSQLVSETLSWALLLLLIRCTRQPSKEIKSAGLPFQSQIESRTGSCWVVAVAIATATFCSAENNAAGALLPALTPILFFIQRQLNYQQWTSETRQSETQIRSATMWSTVAIALFSIYILASYFCNWLSLVLAVVELLACLAVYGTLLPKPTATNPKVTLFVDIETDITSLAPRVTSLLLIALVLQTLLMGFMPFDLSITLLSSVAKALTWFFIMELARQASWAVAAIIKTFAIFATRSPFIQSFDGQALSHVVGSGLMLGQLIMLVPRQSFNRTLLWVLMAVPALPYLANLHNIQAAHSRAIIFASTHEHPVESIIRRANADFDNLLLRQSESYIDACDEYHRRYGVEPPPGFEEWFEYAKSRDSKIIDNFDIMYESIIPLWSLSGQKISQAVKYVQMSSQNEVWTCRLSGQTTAKMDCAHQWRNYDRNLSKLFNRLMADIKGVLPDVEFLVNHLDEPRVIFPQSQEQAEQISGVRLKDLSHTSTWDSLVHYCNRSERKDTAMDESTINSFGLPFVQDTSISRDICKHPKYRHMHGLFMSPTSFRLIEGMVPVLSTGSPSIMGDILFPSPAYIESEFLYSDEHDLDWSRKKNNVYWAGSTTGGFVTNNQWKNHHRQRFVSLVQMLDKSKHVYLADKGGIVQRVTSSFLNSRLFDVAFTRVFQCAKKSCREQSFFYRMKAWADKDEALRSRLSFDLDGNGISGRWYKLVASKSAPLKQTLLREWHDDRLLPWVHFIPVSLGMEELPELVMYLTSMTQGQQRAKDIADRGRKWFSQALREVDMGIYVYRLLLELARLQDPTRPKLTQAKYWSAQAQKNTTALK